MCGIKAGTKVNFNKLTLGEGKKKVKTGIQWPTTSCIPLIPMARWIHLDILQNHTFKSHLKTKPAEHDDGRRVEKKKLHVHINKFKAFSYLFVHRVSTGALPTGM